MFSPYLAFLTYMVIFLSWQVCRLKGLNFTSRVFWQTFRLSDLDTTFVSGCPLSFLESCQRVLSLISHEREHVSSDQKRATTRRAIDNRKAKKWMQLKSSTMRVVHSTGATYRSPEIPTVHVCSAFWRNRVCTRKAEDGFQELESDPRDCEPGHPSPQQPGRVQTDRGFLLAQLSKDCGSDTISEP